MAVKPVDPFQTSAPHTITEYYNHPTEGYIPFDANTRQFHRLKHSHPVYLPDGFPKKQPGIRTCSEPTDGNMGCPKWAGCPFKDYPYVGPGTMIIEKNGAISAANCYDYYETTRGGRPVSQNHLGMDGWAPRTDITTMPVLGRTWALQSGRLNEDSSRTEVLNTRPKVWEMEIGDLMPPWWWLMKKKGLPLPKGAERYPELVDAYAPEDQSKESQASSSPSASRGGPKRRTKKHTE